MIILTEKNPSSASDFFTQEADVLLAEELKVKFRRLISDQDKQFNILDNYEFTFTDAQIFGFLRDSIEDINSGMPRTDYTISGIGDPAFVVNGAMVLALISKGILETKNNLSFSDQGLSINTYDKGPNYQAWAGLISSKYERTRIEYKQYEVFRSPFQGVASDFARMNYEEE